MGISESFDNGKYEVRFENDGKLYAYRHGEEWRDLVGDNLILAMLHEVEQLRNNIEDAKSCLYGVPIECSEVVCKNTIDILNRK